MWLASSQPVSQIDIRDIQWPKFRVVLVTEKKQNMFWHR